MSEAVVIDHISKIYTMPGKQKSGPMGRLFHLQEKEPFYALKDISMKVHYGESVGLIGMNGSGKSTLSNLICGITMPDRGSITLNGTPVLIAINMGLNLQMTGMENIEYRGLLIGLTHKEIQKLTPTIVEFAGLGEFINQPVKKYSSGMRSRLSFAISVNIHPDILVVDEALSVGDTTFAARCQERMKSFRTDGKCIFFVSHNIQQVYSFCDHVAWLEYGALKAYGTTDEVLPQYERFLSNFSRLKQEEQKLYKKDALKAQAALIG